MKGWICLLSIVLVMGGAQDVVAADSLKKVIQAVVLENMNASQKENMAALLKTIHPESPILDMTRQQSEMVFSQYRLKYKIHAIHVIGEDGDYAVARVDVTTTGVEGPGYNDNRSSLLQVFRKDGESWKYWNQLLLDVQYLE